MFIATAGQTAFSGSDENSNTLSYTAANLIVIVNGVVLEPSVDYTATDGLTITLTDAATLNDEVHIIAFKSFTTADMVSATNGGTFGNDVNILGNVGIGTSSPSVTLDARLGTATGKVAEFHNSVGYGIGFTVESDGGVNTINAETNQALAFATNGASNERARIDASGNLLVGKTSTDNTSNGTVVDTNGTVKIVRSSEYLLQLNRKTTDGEIVRFQKDGSTVGSIGTIGGFTVIGSGDTGILFDATEDAVKPRNSSTASRDAAIDLGVSGDRFKDLYLSGGAYLGGTGSANKLDDYEEGTWTPSLSGYTMASGNAGWYVKIGRTCYVTANVTWSSGSGNVSYIDGLPFTASTSSNGDYAANSIPMIEVAGITPNGSNDVFYGRVGANSYTGSIQVLQVDYSSGVHTGTPPTWSSSGTLRISFTYSTS